MRSDLIPFRLDNTNRTEPFRSAHLAELAQRIREINLRHGADTATTGDHAIDLGWHPPDSPSTTTTTIPARLALRATHEWFSHSPTPHSLPPPAAFASDGHWLPPLTLLLHAAACAWRHALQSGWRSDHAWVVWVGRQVWPAMQALQAFDRAAPGLARRTLLINADTPAERLWCADLALRSPSCVAVIVDGRRWDMAATRRLQLAAHAGVRALGLVARAPHERQELSAASTRWWATPLACPPQSPHEHDLPLARWQVRLLRSKGHGISAGASGLARAGPPPKHTPLHPLITHPPVMTAAAVVDAPMPSPDPMPALASWVVESCRESVRLRLPAHLVHRPAAPPLASAV